MTLGILGVRSMRTSGLTDSVGNVMTEGYSVCWILGYSGTGYGDVYISLLVYGMGYVQLLDIYEQYGHRILG